jgi:uncharacterized protein YdeI (YjbR/CyaY-like superfamily)
VKARAFGDAARFRAWLERHHATVAELVVRCHKTSRAREGLTYRQALDEALCFGWIDGVRRSVDAVSFAVRFTPRKPGSAWSRVNVARAAELKADGRMQPAGLAALARRRTTEYSYEARPQTLAPAFLRRLREHGAASAFFQAQPPWYRRTSAFWVMSAKRPETRERRFAVLLASATAGARVPLLQR